MTRIQSLLAHGAAILLALIGLALWEAQGVSIMRATVLSFCL